MKFLLNVSFPKWVLNQGATAGRGNELAWSKNTFEGHTHHVRLSGKVRDIQIIRIQGDVGIDRIILVLRPLYVCYQSSVHCAQKPNIQLHWSRKHNQCYTMGCEQTWIERRITKGVLCVIDNGIGLPVGTSKQWNSTLRFKVSIWEEVADEAGYEYFTVLHKLTWHCSELLDNGDHDISV